MMIMYFKDQMIEKGVKNQTPQMQSKFKKEIFLVVEMITLSNLLVYKPLKKLVGQDSNLNNSLINLLL